MKEQNQNPRIKGHVKFYDPVKGYGYITLEDGSDVYVNRRQVDSGRTYVGFNPGDEVELGVYTNSKNNKTSASHVMLIETPEATTEAAPETNSPDTSL